MNFNRKKTCHFCRKKIDEVDYRDSQLLRRYISAWAKIKPAKNTGNCSKHQRSLTQGIKRARFLAFLPYVSR